MTTSGFILLLEHHDWYFDRSDDNRVYSRGLGNQKRLLYLCQEQPELFRLYNHASNCVIRNIPFDFQSVLGTTPQAGSKQHTQTTTPMKDLLWPIFEPLVNKIVEAIDRNTAAKTCGTRAPAPVPEEQPAPVAEKPAAKPATKPKAEKPAAKPAPAAEPAEIISENRLRATVKTLPPDEQKKLGRFIKETYAVGTMAEIPEDARGTIHAEALKAGATDTDPDADTGFSVD